MHHSKKNTLNYLIIWRTTSFIWLPSPFEDAVIVCKVAHWRFFGASDQYSSDTFISFVKLQMNMYWKLTIGSLMAFGVLGFITESKVSLQKATVTIRKMSFIIFIHTHTHTHVCTHKLTYTYIHTHMHAHTNTHTHTQALKANPTVLTGPIWSLCSVDSNNKRSVQRRTRRA